MQLYQVTVENDRYKTITGIKNQIKSEHAEKGLKTEVSKILT